MEVAFSGWDIVPVDTQDIALMNMYSIVQGQVLDVACDHHFGFAVCLQLGDA